MPNENQEDLKDEAIKILKHINPELQPYGKRFFEALARLIVNVGIETVFMRFNPESSGHEIFLRKRNEDETYPGQWHIPGSLLRYGEEIDDVFERILSEEYCGTAASGFQFVGFYNNIKEARGHALQIVYRCDVEYNGKPEAGLGFWFPLGALPDPIVDHHRETIIPMATA